MNPDERLLTAVRILARDKAPGGKDVKGLGFLIGERHIMTCAHVVASALTRREEWIGQAAPGPDQLVRVEFLADLSQDPVFAFVHTWCAEVAASDRARKPEDIAVLELAAEYSAPANARCVVAAAAVEPETTVRGYGWKDRVSGKALKGSVDEKIEIRRWSISAPDDDLAADPGSSGTALWSTQLGGVVGMMAEIQQRRTGLFIPIDVLNDVWPIPLAGDVTSQRGAQALAAGRSLGARLADRLQDCDRDTHETLFEVELQRISQRRLDPLLCVYGAVEPDLPEMFRDRLLEGPLKLRLEGSARFDIKPINWPPRAGRSLTADLDFFKAQLKTAFGAPGADPAVLQAAYNKGHWPWLLYSQIDRADFGPAQKNLLRAWQTFLRRIGRGGLNKPLAHLVVVRLDDADIHHDYDRSEAALLSAYDAALSEPSIAAILRLPPLPRLGHDEVSIWIGNIADQLNLDRATVDRLKTGARAEFSPAKRRRLSDVESWVLAQRGA